MSVSFWRKSLEHHCSGLSLRCSRFKFVKRLTVAISLQSVGVKGSGMYKKFLHSAVIATTLAVGAFAADVVVRIGPPHAIVERRVPPPSRGHVWVSGYHRWDGRAYVWEPGRWELPPRPRAHWVPHRWVHRHGGWVLVEGHWR